MLEATDFYPNDTMLQIVLWIEAVLYLGLGTSQIFDDFFEKPKNWMSVGGRVNGWIRLQYKLGHKMHAGLCFVLGFTALNGALEGVVSRFELELIFISFACIMPVTWATSLPGRLAVVLTLVRPEFWFQIVMFGFFSYLVRPEILVLCVVFNLWGVVVYILHTRKRYFVPYTYETLRSDIIRADGDEAEVGQLDKMAGYSPEEPARNSG
jgi:hypothetical protein